MSERSGLFNSTWDYRSGGYQADPENTGWPELWEDLGQAISRAEDLTLPGAAITAAEHERDLLLDAYLESLTIGSDLTGFITAVNHQNPEIRKLSFEFARHVFDIDTDLALTALFKLSHDDEPIVRQQAMRDMLSFLYGEDDGGLSAPLELPSEQRDRLANILYVAIKDINNAAGSLSS